MHKYKTFPTSFIAKTYPKLLPKLKAAHTHEPDNRDDMSQ